MAGAEYAATGILEAKRSLRGNWRAGNTARSRLSGGLQHRHLSYRADKLTHYLKHGTLLSDVEGKAFRRLPAENYNVTARCMGKTKLIEHIWVTSSDIGHCNVGHQYCLKNCVSYTTGPGNLIRPENKPPRLYADSRKAALEAGVVLLET